MTVTEVTDPHMSQDGQTRHPTRDAMGTGTRRRLWEIRAQAAIDELRATTQCESADGTAGNGKRQRTLRQIRQQLASAESYLDLRWSFGTWLHATRLEGAWGQIHHARVLAIEVMDTDQLAAFAPRVLALADKYLRHGTVTTHEPVLQAIKPWYDRLAVTVPAAEDRANSHRTGSHHTNGASPWRRREHSISLPDRYALAAALRECYNRVGDEYQRLRRFQAVMTVTTVALLVVVVGLIAAGWRWPHIVPLCFPDPSAVVTQPVPDIPTVCPTGVNGAPSSGDVATIVLFGLLGSTLATVRLVVRPAVPSVVPMTTTRGTQILLKALTGVLTATLGLMFLRAGVIPGFTQVDTQAQILAYAIVFGASQELITRFVDKRSNDLLDAATTSEHVTEGSAKPRSRGMSEARPTG